MKDNNEVLGKSMQGKWYVPDKWCVSPYNCVEETRAGFPNIPEKLSIRDVTLCEGPHQPGVKFKLEDLLKIAFALREAGITKTKLLIGNFQTFEFLSVIKQEIPDMFIHVIFPIFDYDQYINSDEKVLLDMDLLVKYGIDEIDIPGNNSWNIPDHVAKASSQEARLERYARMTREARSRGLLVEAAHVDSTRVPWDDLNEFHANAVQAGATSIGIYDSYGTITPYGMQYLVERTIKEYNLPVLVHAHNDLGSAEASTIGGVLGGASEADLSILGLGDRAGNASLEEVIMQLELNYGVKTGVKLEKLLGVCRLVEKISGIELPYIKPITGKNVFAHESEAHASMILSQGVNLNYASKHEAYAPQVVGGQREVRFGGTSLTGTMIRIRMEQLGLKFGENEIKEVSNRIREIFVSEHKDISIEEFDEIAYQTCK